MKYQVTDEQKDMRLDNYLSEVMEISRNKASKIIKDGCTKVNGQEVKNSYSVKSGDEIIVNYEEKEVPFVPEEMNLDIIYEDEDIIIVNKGNGITVHPGVGNKNGTLVNGLMYHSKNLSTNNGEFRPGIVHRIDAYTTGLLMVAKNDSTHEFLAKQLEEKTVTRTYVALVWGVIKNDTGTIDAPIGRDKSDRKKMGVTENNSKHAVTHFKVLERYANTTLIELNLETGRTHQIRVHMNYIGYPIVNDPVYGRKRTIDETGQVLHAKTIGFIHPKTKERMEFTSELPESFSNILELFKNE